ncbi:MAG TPA: hypothetical protein VF897_16255 [Roseiflexaceae bacterium]
MNGYAFDLDPRDPRELRAGRWRTLAPALIGVALITVIAGLRWSPERTWSTLLLSNLYLLFVCLAGALFISIQFLSNSGWWVVLRRVPEAMMAGLPIVAILMLSLFFGREVLYPWAHASAASPAATAAAGAAAEAAVGEAASASAFASLYLNPTFVFVRMAIVLAAWVWLARAIRKTSLRQDDDPALAAMYHRRLVIYGAIFTVVFGVSFSIGSVDWIMSLEPHWSSTIFAVYVFAGLLVSGLAALTLIVILLRHFEPLEGIVLDSHLHDLGKLVFAFSTFWAYIWLSQYLLIWYGNLPDEIPYYAHRTGGPWLRWFLLNPVLNWGVPFLVLLPHASKHNARVLGAVCVLILCGHYLDLYLLIVPDTLKAPAIGPLEILVPIGYVSLFVMLTRRALAQAPLVPRHDPYLDESLHHHF